MSEPFPLDPERVEERGAFPIHSDEPRPIMSAEGARLRAFFLLLAWREAHGN